MNKIEFFETPYKNYYASKTGEIYSIFSKKCLTPKIDKDANEAASDLKMKINCIYVRCKRHKNAEYITRDYVFRYKINDNEKSVTTKEIA